METNNQFLPRDHDMLVTLVSKVDQLTSDIKDLKDTSMIRISKAESRLDIIDIYHASHPLNRFDELANWADTFRANYKLIAITGGMGIGLVGAILERVLQNIFHF